MKLLYTLVTPKFLLLILLFSGSTVNAQDNSYISNAYKDYSSAAREVVYLHLNKSIYIKGEDIGFTAYVMDKKEKKPSLITTNLYVSIEDEEKNIVKQILIKVIDGVASNTLKVDSLFTSGYYNIKAYTNWSRNFNEKNYFEETIKVINPDNEEFYKVENTDNKIDAQFLPESGHLLHGVINTIGVTIKDYLGYGVPFAKGEVVDQNNEVLSTFETNQFGIGKFQLLPKLGDTYIVKINNKNKTFSFAFIHKIERKGIILSLKQLKSKVFVSIKTNEETLASIKNKKNTLMIHNGDNYEIMDVYFTDKTVITKAIENSQMATGVNIFTLFNENNKPLAERLFFNYLGLDIKSSNSLTFTEKSDSLTLNLKFKEINPKTLNSISISVLPKGTKSYNRHSSIISYTYLEPYVNGTIEQAKYYFSNIDTKKQYELDNLLITQGWSSYSWEEIFQNTKTIKYPFEQGITIKANFAIKNIDDNEDFSYLMHAVSDEAPRVFPIQKGDNTFLIENLFPVGTNSIYLSKMTSKDGLLPASLYMQFFPNQIPQLNRNNILLSPKPDYKVLESLNAYSDFKYNKSDNVQKLDEVVVKSIKRKDSLKMGRIGRVFDMREYDNIPHRISLKEFLTNRGLLVYDSYNAFNVFSKQAGYLIGFKIYLDDWELYDTSLLGVYDLSNIDFIEFNKGSVAIPGFLRIYSNKKSPIGYNKKTIQEFKIPLSFSNEKTFYVPKYKTINDSFYTDYGVLDWKPHLKIDENGFYKLNIAKPIVPITLYIEGIANNGSFIFEEKTVSIN